MALDAELDHRLRGLAEGAIAIAIGLGELLRTVDEPLREEAFSRLRLVRDSALPEQQVLRAVLSTMINDPPQ